MMKKRFIISYAVSFLLLLSISLSCTAAENFSAETEAGTASDKYTVYIINNNLHTGIILPVKNPLSGKIDALKYFDSFSFIDIGWGEEKYYQNPDDNFCMGARAVLLPNTSVIRIEGYENFTDYIIGWSDYAVKLSLTEAQYTKLAEFIENSFMKDNSNELIITKRKHSGSIIFFKSVYRYHMFNTCNTWVAEALKSSGLNVSPFFTITAGQLYDEIKDKGVILKAMK